MNENEIESHVDRGRRLLNGMWSKAEKDDAPVDPVIDELINSKFVSIRFCLPTQLLGKLADPRVDCLCLQKGAQDDPSSWDPRSFAAKVVVPWVGRNQSVLGSSTDPYVSKPLRKPRLEKGAANVKGREEWDTLYDVLAEVEKKNTVDFTRARLRDTLRSIYRKLAASSFEYVVPRRVSMEQVRNAVHDFLSESSGGERGLAVAAAFFETIGKEFGIYSEVRRSAINASDLATRQAADIECIGPDGEIRLVIEVKERNLTLTDVHSAIAKARKISLRDLLFNVPGTAATDEAGISEVIRKTWASGTSLYRLTIDELLKVGLVLTGEAGQRSFLAEVGEQLNAFNTQPDNKRRWKDILERL